MQATLKKKVMTVIVLSLFVLSKMNAQWISNPPYLYNTTQSIGIGVAAPSQLLQVTGGNIDVNTGTYGYMIGAATVLYKNGLGSNFIGERAGQFATTTNSVTCVGYGAGSGTTGANHSGTGSTLLGYASGTVLTTGDYNTFSGFKSGFSNTTGASNTASGAFSLYTNVSTSANSAFGRYALEDNTASNNSALGYQALANNTSGTPNCAFGYQSAYTCTTGTNNCSFGYLSLFSNGNGIKNCAFGDEALYTNTASQNSAFGYQALKLNTNGTNNVALGFQCMDSNTSGDYNTAVGKSALQSNTTTNDNSAFGSEALYTNTGTSNSGFGANALRSNSTGAYNCSMGDAGLYSNTTGNYNTALGTYALFTNTIPSNNTAVGYQSIYNANAEANTAIGYKTLFNGTTAANNVAAGYQAGTVLTTGGSNTLLGYSANVAAACSTASNMTALGSGAIVSVATGNDIQLGNSSIASIHAAVTTITSSDSRFKTNVTENVKGLSFIKKLRPVTYKLNTEAMDDFVTANLPDSIKTTHKAGLNFAPSSAIVHSGFLAQEVEQAAQEVGYVSSIVYHPSHNNDMYGIAYAEIVVPLVKAVQEQQVIIEKQDSINQALQNQINQILSTCCGAGNRTNQNNTGGTDKGTGSVDVQLSDANNVVLNQNVPNPYAESTVITFTIPENAGFAQIIFNDTKGQILKIVDIKTKGRGQLNVFASDLSSGVYSYSLYIDGKIMDTKKMLKTQ
jgi:trimeric autotransporter adhesin